MGYHLDCLAWACRTRRWLVYPVSVLLQACRSVAVAMATAPTPRPQMAVMRVDVHRCQASAMASWQRKREAISVLRDRIDRDESATARDRGPSPVEMFRRVLGRGWRNQSLL